MFAGSRGRGCSDLLDAEWPGPECREHFRCCGAGSDEWRSLVDLGELFRSSATGTDRVVNERLVELGARRAIDRGASKRGCPRAARSPWISRSDIEPVRDTRIDPIAISALPSSSTQPIPAELSAERAPGDTRRAATMSGLLLIRE